MLKKSFDIRNAEVICYVDLPIDPLSLTRAESFAAFLTEEAPFCRDIRQEGMEFLPTDESERNYELIRYFFRDAKTAKREKYAVARMIEALGRQWLAIESSECVTMPDDFFAPTAEQTQGNDCEDPQTFRSYFYREMARRYGDEYAAFQEALDKQHSNIRH